MSSSKKVVLILLGALTAVMVVVQLVMGKLLAAGDARLAAAHKHLGYTAVVVALVYVFLSLSAIAASPVRQREP